MEDQYGSDFITISDEDGTEYTGGKTVRVATPLEKLKYFIKK